MHRFIRKNQGDCDEAIDPKCWRICEALDLENDHSKRERTTQRGKEGGGVQDVEDGQ